jgi:hypothetical protein
MERSEFPLKSMTALSVSLIFLILVLSLLTVDMLGCVAIDEVNRVDVLSRQNENRSFEPIEITIRRD